MNDWLKLMDSKYQWSQFHYVAGVFDMPNMGNWDGVYKFNKEKDGGVFFVYRNGSPDNTRTFLCPVVNANQNYLLFSPISGKDWGVYRGIDLINKGIRIELPKKYSAEVLGIEIVN